MSGVLARDLARALDPILLSRDCGIEPDPWQSDLLCSTSTRVLMLNARQTGKSTTAAVMGLHSALYAPPALVLLVSPSQRQSGELFEAVRKLWTRLPDPPEAEVESLTRVRFTNGSRIISLPGSETTVRGYGAATDVIIDEAARVSDALLAAVRPSLAVTNGRLIALSTPAGKRGWFYETYTNGDASWMRVKVLASECPRITPEFLASERRELGELMYRQEYECEFIDDGAAVFSDTLIRAALKSGLECVF